MAREFDEGRRLALNNIKDEVDRIVATEIFWAESEVAAQEDNVKAARNRVEFAAKQTSVNMYLETLTGWTRNLQNCMAQLEIAKARLSAKKDVQRALADRRKQ